MASYKMYIAFVTMTFVASKFARALNNECPVACFCNRDSKIVYCARTGLPRIPQEFPDDYVQLNINHNLFESSKISRSNLTRYTGLRHLYMSDCGLEYIAVGTFRDMRELQWLDLSSNRLKAIQDNTFQGSNLVHLFLNGNRNLQLSSGSFAGLAVTGLYLHECSLNQMPLGVLKPIQGLANLWLNGNELTRIDPDLEPLLVALVHLRLTSNPFHCNCQTKWLKQFYDEHQDKFEGAGPPACLTPSLLKGQLFDELRLDSLVCQPPMFKNVDAVLDEAKNGLLRCSAVGDPAPTMYWVQPSGQVDKYIPTKNESYNEALLNVSAIEKGRADLTGSYFCYARNDAGNVTLTINVTWPAPRSRAPGLPLTPVPRITPLHAISLPPRNNVERPVAVDEPTTPGTTQIPTVYGTQASAPRNHQRRFSLGELIGAVVGTFVCTLLLCIIIIPFVVRRCYAAPVCSPRASPRHFNHGTPKPSHPAAVPFYPGQTPRDIPQTYTFESNHYDSLGSYSKR